MQTMSPNAAAPPPLPPKTRKKAHVVSIRVSSAQTAPQITASDGGCVRISVNRLPVGYYLYNGFKCADHIEDAIVSPTPPPPPPKSTSVRVTVNGEDKKRTKNTSPEPEKNGIIEPDTRNGIEETEKNGNENPPEKRNGNENPPEKRNGIVTEPEKSVQEKRSSVVTELLKKNGTITELLKKTVTVPEKNGVVAVPDKDSVVTVPEKDGIVAVPEKNSVTVPEKRNGIVAVLRKNGMTESEKNLPEATNGTAGAKCQSPSSESEPLKEVSPMNSVKRRSSPKVVEERTYEERTAPVAAVSYDADHYYDFHLHEAQPTAGEQADGDEDYFAGCRSFGLQESSIKSSKGTIRGVKNRVRAGVATFLQMQSTQPFAAKEAGQVVVYTTTMGIVRATAQRCARVRQILRTLLVRFEERDLFMARDAQAELQSRLGTSGLPQLPQVFVEGRLLGDAETVERLNESGELRKMLKPYKSPDAATPCEVCGGYRLLPCAVCNGSKKSVHRNHFTAELVALRCMNCDEVGLVRCYAC